MKRNLKTKPSLSKYQLLTLCVIVPWMNIGCTGISPARMVPEDLPQSSTKIGHAVRVMGVTGGTESTNFREKVVNNDEFRQALVRALDESGLFRGVSTDQGDLDLYATINSQNQRQQLQFTATMVVSYKFVNRARDVVWSASYDSKATSLAFNGFSRSRHTREACVRETLSPLIQGLIKTWPKKYSYAVQPRTVAQARDVTGVIVLDTQGESIPRVL